MEIIQNTHNTYRPDITAYYKTIQHLPNVLSFNELLEKYDGLKMLHNPSYFNMLYKWETGILPHPPFVFGLKSGAFFSAASIVFCYKKNDKEYIKQLPYRYMSQYLGNNESMFTQFLKSQFSTSDWKVLAEFSNCCTLKCQRIRAENEERKTLLLETLLKFKNRLTERMVVLDFEQLLEKHNQFSLFESDRNWNHFHWYRKGLATWKNGKTLHPPILFGTESGLLFGKTGFICNYGIDRVENEKKRYYQKIDYRNINHPEFEKRMAKYLTNDEFEILKELGNCMKN